MVLSPCALCLPFASCGVGWVLAVVSFERDGEPFGSIRHAEFLELSGCQFPVQCCALFCVDFSVSHHGFITKLVTTAMQNDTHDLLLDVPVDG